MADQENSQDQHPFRDELTRKLNEKFRLKDIEWILIHAYDFTYNNNWKLKAFAQPYIKKESAERRADEVLGHSNWENDFTMPDRQGRFKFQISIRKDPDAEWISKRSAGSIDQNAKGGFASDAFEISESFAEKRTWAKHGIGRYLKRVPQTQVQVSSSYKEGWNKHRFKSNVKEKKVSFYWKPPQLPGWALHEEDSYDDNNSGEEPDMPAPEEDKTKKVPASEAQWATIDNYYANIPDNEKDKWEDYLFVDEIENGEVVGKRRRKISESTADKIITSMKQGYGALNDDGVPEDIAELKNLREGDSEKK